MTLIDDDLRELCIGALGARKIMPLAIQGGLYYPVDMVNPRQMHGNVILAIGWNRYKNRLCKRAFRFPW